MADQAPEVVIVDPSGTEHHFPAGFDPQKAAAIVRASQPAKATATPDWSDKLGLHEPTASPTLGFLRGAATSAVDMAEGAASGAASTVYHGGDLIRRVAGMPRIIDKPEVKQAMHAPETFSGAVGRTAEQAAEFAAPLSKVSKGMKGTSLIARMAADAAASGGVSAVQSGGDPVATGTGIVLGAAAPAVAAGARGLAGVAKNAAAGAAEDGIGGAIAGAVRGAAPVEPKAMLVQALKPAASNTGFTSALDRALPEIKASEVNIGKPVETANEMMAAVKDAKQRVWSQYEAIAGPRANSMADGTPVADAMVQSIPKRTLQQDPELAAAIRAKAETYRKSFPLQEMEQLLTETNADLESYYKKFPTAQRKALMASPEIAHTVAEGQALRDAIYTTLDGEGQPPAARELKQRYGALMNVEDALQRRLNVAARQQPENLSQQIGKVRAAGQMAKGGWRLLHGDISGAADIAGARAGSAMADYLKEQQTTDALIRRALAATKELPAAVRTPTARPIAGLLERGAVPVGSVPDTSFARGVPAVPAQNGRLALPPGREAIPSSGVSDSSFVRGVPAQPVAAARKALPPGRTSIVGQAVENSGVRGVPATRTVQRDPRSGRMRRIFVGEGR